MAGWLGGGLVCIVHHPTSQPTTTMQYVVTLWATLHVYIPVPSCQQSSSLQPFRGMPFKSQPCHTTHPSIYYLISSQPHPNPTDSQWRGCGHIWLHFHPVCAHPRGGGAGCSTGSNRHHHHQHAGAVQDQQHLVQLLRRISAASVTTSSSLTTCALSCRQHERLPPPPQYHRVICCG